MIQTVINTTYRGQPLAANTDISDYPKDYIQDCLDAGIAVDSQAFDAEVETEKDLSDMTVEELKGVAKGYEIEGYGNMKKAQLIEVIEAHEASEGGED